MDVTITINCNNAAFDGPDCGYEISSLLKGIANDFMDKGKDAVSLMGGYGFADSNGNRCGTVRISK